MPNNSKVRRGGTESPSDGGEVVAGGVGDGASAVDQGVSGAELRLALDNLSLAVLVRSLAGSVVMVNKAFSEIFGYSSDEVVGLDVGMLLHAQRGYLVEEITAAIRAGDARGFSGNGNMLCKDGSTLRIRISITTIVHNGEMLVVSFIEDWSDIFWSDPHAH